MFHNVSITFAVFFHLFRHLFYHPNARQLVTWNFERPKQFFLIWLINICAIPRVLLASQQVNTFDFGLQAYSPPSSHVHAGTGVTISWEFPLVPSPALVTGAGAEREVQVWRWHRWKTWSMLPCGYIFHGEPRGRCASSCHFGWRLELLARDWSSARPSELDCDIGFWRVRDLLNAIWFLLNYLSNRFAGWNSDH